MRFMKAFLACSAVYITACMIMEPSVCMTAAYDALKLCANAVLPTLFPFFVCSSLFVSLGFVSRLSLGFDKIMKPLFKVSGTGALAAVMGVLSGYPVGAKCAADLYNEGRITKAEAERLLAFCNNSGPMFIIGTVGTAVFGNANVGLILYAIHIISSFLSGVIFSRLYIAEDKKKSMIDKKEKTINAFEAMGKAIGDSADTIIKICGFVVFFAVIGRSLPHVLGREVIYSCLEITGGISDFSVLNIDFVLKLSCVSLFLAMSGISVFLQVGVILKDSGLKMSPYLIGKSIQGVISFCMTYLFFSMVNLCEKGDMFMPQSVDSGAFSGLNTSTFGAGAIESVAWSLAVLFALIIINKGINKVFDKS